MSEHQAMREVANRLRGMAKQQSGSDAHELRELAWKLEAAIGPPPADNAHVAPGCEQFTNPGQPAP